MNTGFGLLRSRLEHEQKRLIEELEQLEASTPSVQERREGSPFGKREEEATESLELEKRLTLYSLLLPYGGLDPPTVALIGDVFGLSRIGVIIGALVVGWGAGAAIGPAVGGYIFDVNGNYILAFLVGAAAMLTAAVLILLVRGPGRGVQPLSKH